jgi:YVTN family beta-propeller protein
VVANSFSGNVATVNLKGRPQPQLLTVRGMPFGVAVSPDGRRAYITASQLDEVAVLDLDAGRTIGMVRVGRRPRAVALTPDGKTLVAANLAGASLSIVDTQSLRESARVALRGTNVRGVAISADGTEAYAVAMPAFNNRPTADPREIWHNIVQGVFLSGETSSVGENQWMDFARLPGSSELIGSPDQHGIVVDRALRHAWVSVAGRDVVTRITIHDRLRDAAWPISQVETPVGASPRGLALSPDGREVWVANSLGNSVSVIDAGTMKLRVTIPLGAASRADPHLVGRYLFGSGALTRSQRFTCNSCHPDGGTDGLTWSFVHVTDRFGRRNSRDLRAGIAETAPFRWSGFDRELGGFIREEAIGLLQGPTPTAEQIGRLAAAVGVPRLPPSPFRQEDGSLTPAAERGRALFVGKAGCSSCHQGSMLGGTAMRAWIGTTREGQTVDVPHLVGAYDSAPYLHDGRADTLEAIFERHNPEQLHGNAHLLTKDELAQVLEYVRQQ